MGGNSKLSSWRQNNARLAPLHYDEGTITVVFHLMNPTRILWRLVHQGGDLWLDKVESVSGRQEPKSKACTADCESLKS
jgi:hypothetical protein